MERLFTVANDSTLIELIASARERLVILAPGLSKELAKKIAERVTAPDRPGTVAIIVDIDPEVCRLGYGEIDAVDILRSALKSRGLDVQTQPGVRIGLIVADSEIMVYSPTPQLIEAGSKTEVKPNAVRIGNQAANDLVAACGANVAAAVNVAKVANAADVASVVNAAKVTDGIGGPNTANVESKSERKQEVGLTPISEKKLEETKQDLKAVPPKEFNIARRERVFNYMLEFVELSIEHFKLDTRTVELPAFLLDMEELAEDFRNTFRVFKSSAPFAFEIAKPDKPGEKWQLSEKWLTKESDRIRKKYLVPVSKFGWLILKRNKPDFEKEVAALKATLTLYQDKVRTTMESKVAEAQSRLMESLLPRLVKSPPESWCIRSSRGIPDESECRSKLETELHWVFTRVSVAYNPEITCLFKAVTYDTITQDHRFRAAIEKHYGKETASRLFDEHESSVAQQPSLPTANSR